MNNFDLLCSSRLGALIEVARTAEAVRSTLKLPRPRLRGEESLQSKDEYKAVDPSASAKCFAILNHLDANNSLGQIKSIEIQSKELSAFDDSVALLGKDYSISLPDDQVRQTRQKLILKALAASTTKDFKVNSWFVIQGEFQSVQAPNGLQLVFSYVPSLPEKIKFVCVPELKLVTDDLREALAADRVNASVFGKITASTSIGENVGYQFTPYAIFR